MAGDVILAMPHDASFQLSAKVSEKRDIVSDFPLKFIEPPPPPPPTPAPKADPKPAPEAKGGVAKAGTPASPANPTPPKTPVAKGQPPSKTGPIIAPVYVERAPAVAPYTLRRLTAICGSGDAMISVASFGGTVRLKKI